MLFENEYRGILTGSKFLLQETSTGNLLAQVYDVINLN
jgi:hypothetical protein